MLDIFKRLCSRTWGGKYPQTPKVNFLHLLCYTTKKLIRPPYGCYITYIRNNIVTDHSLVTSRQDK